MIEAKDGEQTGTLDDFLVDDRRWSLDYLVIDTGQRVGRKRVLVATDWLCNVRDLDRVFRVGLTGDDIRDCPEFDPAAPANVQAEMRRYDYYGRPKGRVGEP